MTKRQKIDFIKSVIAGKVDYSAFPQLKKLLFFREKGANYVDKDGQEYTLEQIEERAGNSPGVLMFVSCENMSDEQIEKYKTEADAGTEEE